MKPVEHKFSGIGSLMTVALITMMPVEAFAQVQKVTGTLQKVVDILSAAAVLAFTIAIMWVGYKMAFQHAKWSEVSNILIGGIFIGAAAVLAQMLTAS